MGRVQGKLATTLLESDFASAAEFIDAVDDASTEMILTIFALLSARVSNAILDSICMPYILQELGTGLMSVVLRQDIEYFDSQDSSVTVSRVQDDTRNAFDAFTEKWVELARYVYQFVFGLSLVCAMHWQLCVASVCLFPLYAVAQVLGGKAVDRLWVRFNERSTDVSVKAHEILSSFRTVRSFDAETREYGQYKARMDAMHAIVTETGKVHAVMEGLSTLTLWGTTALLLFLAGRMAARGDIEPGDVITLMNLLNAWGTSFAGVFSSFEEARGSNVSCAKLKDIIDRAIRIPIDRGMKIEMAAGRIEFRDVSFRYPMRAENAIDGLSFVVEAGETVAIVGESGCGKSTALALIQRFYDADDGQILLDGIDVRTIEPLSLRRQVAIVPQSPVMFSMSVKNNIRFGVPHARRSDVVAAAEAANAAGFIAELPERYRTPVCQATLSGGQKQRICIARAVMMRAPVLLLDEATAALDTENEGLVQEALQRYGAGRTTIVVAHRLATVAHASRIFVMDGGRLVQIGTHEELLQDRDGAYARLVANQLQ
jgi:ABC-type multidrug transport system fused ATPase/permease subunit